mmetsp:Transcript_6413/g.7249  ORF Transcript_6413/g.7249 Transcript_6413/m.7249 type:complete len:245 (+) Transcript_6413:64-798(+)
MPADIDGLSNPLHPGSISAESKPCKRFPPPHAAFAPPLRTASDALASLPSAGTCGSPASASTSLLLLVSSSHLLISLCIHRLFFTRLRSQISSPALARMTMPRIVLHPSTLDLCNPKSCYFRSSSSAVPRSGTSFVPFREAGIPSACPQISMACPIRCTRAQSQPNQNLASGFLRLTLLSLHLSARLRMLLLLCLQLELVDPRPLRAPRSCCLYRRATFSFLSASIASSLLGFGRRSPHQHWPE